MDNTVYKNRRNSLGKSLPMNSVLLIPGADLQYRNADSSFPFRQDSSFYYMSGFCEPSSLMAIINNSDGISSMIFVPPKDKLKEIWDGYRAGPIGAVEDFLFDKAFDNVTVVTLLDFESIPEQARRYITIRASRIFHDRTLGANALHRFSRQDELVALSILKQAEAAVADHSIFNSHDQFKTVARSRSHKLID